MNHAPRSPYPSRHWSPPRDNHRNLLDQPHITLRRASPYTSPPLGQPGHLCPFSGWAEASWGPHQPGPQGGQGPCLTSTTSPAPGERPETDPGPKEGQQRARTQEAAHARAGQGQAGDGGPAPGAPAAERQAAGVLHLQQVPGEGGGELRGVWRAGAGEGVGFRSPSASSPRAWAGDPMFWGEVSSQGGQLAEGPGETGLVSQGWGPGCASLCA